MKVVTFGELLLRLAPEGHLRFLQEPRFEATFGGGEANVGVSLAEFGAQSVYVTKLPDNDIAQAAINQLRSFGVDTTQIVRGGDRMGIYFLEKGAAQRPSKVIYDRAYSAIAQAKPQEFDWDTILDGADWFHFSGITPALSDDAAQATRDALAAARAHGVKVSCDINYRANLWSREKAGEVMRPMMEYVDLFIGGAEDAEQELGIKPPVSEVLEDGLTPAGYESVARQLIDTYGFKAVACTLRESVSASDNNWGAMLYTGGQAYYSRRYAIHIVDRVGGGDSFSAGLIYALLDGRQPQDAVEFAVAAGVLKHSIEGDYNRITVQEAERLVRTGGNGRVSR